MRKAQKKQAEDFSELLESAHAAIEKAVAARRNDEAMDLLSQCQEGAIRLGEFIESTEGEGVPTISLLESYCDLVYQIHEEIADNSENIRASNVCKRLRKSMIRIQNSIRSDIKVRLEIVFLPYKAAMWDSLESVWMAADADESCDAYVVPIPYYERNNDGSFGSYHYEGGMLPENVPVTYYKSYDMEKRRPDIVYIHNPYDNKNFVTSVAPEYYSEELKKYTKCLVYIPYYINGGMVSEAHSLLSAYQNADYIITQTEAGKEYFHPVIPREKILSLGSPKFDRIVRVSQSTVDISKEWEEKIQGRKVCFYNTSLSDMLSNTDIYLKKMKYVFQCFTNRTDVCLLWRPHPLLESTFHSLRKEYGPLYDELKQYFIGNSLGIYDDTPDIEKSIAVSDAYIGNTGSSVIYLFSAAGKPIFFLDNYIYTPTDKNSWRENIIPDISGKSQEKWMISRGGRLYYAPQEDYHYEYYCDLTEYTFASYYSQVFELHGKIYVCPRWAQNVLVVKDRKIQKKIELEHHPIQYGGFSRAWNIGNYIFLLPDKYPAIVRIDIRNNKVDYIREAVDIFVKNINGQLEAGGSCVWKNQLILASPMDNHVVIIDSESMKTRLLELPIENRCGCMEMAVNEQEIWILPFGGTTVTCWNPENNFVKEYEGVPGNFQCCQKPQGFMCMLKPFGTPAFYENKVILPPYWGNMFICIDRMSGKMSEWKTGLSVDFKKTNKYIDYTGRFAGKTEEAVYRYYHMQESSLYDINVKTGECREIAIIFDYDELLEHECGFGIAAEGYPNCCQEDGFNSLNNFLDGNIKGKQFKKEDQLQAFEKVTSNSNGTSGEKIHSTICAKVRD